MLCDEHAREVTGLQYRQGREECESVAGGLKDDERGIANANERGSEKLRVESSSSQDASIQKSRNQREPRRNFTSVRT